jgi:hypothetical protein
MSADSVSTSTVQHVGRLAETAAGLAVVLEKLLLIDERVTAAKKAVVDAKSSGMVDDILACEHDSCLLTCLLV